jgi:hypothetical protein
MKKQCCKKFQRKGKSCKKCPLRLLLIKEVKKKRQG